MKKNFKRAGVLAVIMALGLALAGCGKTEKQQFTFITAMSDESRTAVINSVVDQLKEKYPDVEFVNESGEDYNNKAKLAFSSGEGYDLIYTDDLGITPLREAGYLLDLAEYRQKT